MREQINGELTLSSHI